VKIYTRSGDVGETALFDGTRVSKADVRVDAYGEIDELNAALGLARAGGVDAQVDEILVQLQRDLHAVGARLADPQHRIAERVAKASVAHEHVERLEAVIDECEGQLPPLQHFILSGGCPSGAALHLARTICRRAERRIVALGPEIVDPPVLVYVNRLSDLLFVLARLVNHRAGVPETEW
jgi:cob(I)alamin adenosyltransferase